ncbi:MAG: hypothetical protein BIFFINMI_02616 [Phycisphaerae bacterium]|nr:hypothetical protein [Phycisphaerae bacterium]
MATDCNTRDPLIRPAFTLIELMIAVGLLAMIFVVASYIFQTSTTVIANAEASAELLIQSNAFARRVRSDIEGVEKNGLFVIGRRNVSAYSTLAESSPGMKKAFRADWMSFFTCTEQGSTTDARLIGHIARVFYGHGDVTDVNSSDFSDVTTDWVLMRHQILLIPRQRISTGSAEASGGDVQGPGLGFEGAANSDYVGNIKQFTRGLLSFVNRDFRWYWIMNYTWQGSVGVSYGPTDNGGNRRAIDEPTYWQTASFYSGGMSMGRRFHLLPHCASFQVQYAMSEDLRAGAGGGVLWRDPPAVGAGNPADPNYDLNDPRHSNQLNTDGRLMFGPGDRWPTLLKITAQCYDPHGRLPAGRRTEVIMPMP